MDKTFTFLQISQDEKGALKPTPLTAMEMMMRSGMNRFH
jgi:hypothetical protein